MHSESRRGGKTDREASEQHDLRPDLSAIAQYPALLRQRPALALSSPTAALIPILILALTALACVSPPRWRADDQPTARDAALLFSRRGAQGLFRNMYASEIPQVPVRKNLRPCCAFGSQLRVRLGPLPIPGYAIGNIVDREHVGLHVYDSGVAQVGSRGDAEGLVHSEHNGLIYTCRGGFIDTAHVRDYADWMIYAGTTMARALESGIEAELPDEGGKRRIRLRPIDPELIDRLGRRGVVIPLAQWLAYQLSVWHEIATWFGWSTTPIFSEKVSAFSPEDLYSNLLGARLAGAVAAQRTARDEYLYNRSLGEWLDDALSYLGATRVEVGEEAMASLDGLWWDSRARLPDPELVRRRNFGGGEALVPWLVPTRAAGPKLRAACGERPEPLAIPNPASVYGRVFRDEVTLEIQPAPEIAAQDPFPRLGRTITQDDFPLLIEVIREQVRAQFGERADRPD